MEKRKEWMKLLAHETFYYSFLSLPFSKLRFRDCGAKQKQWEATAAAQRSSASRSVRASHGAITAPRKEKKDSVGEGEGKGELEQKKKKKREKRVKEIIALGTVLGARGDAHQLFFLRRLLPLLVNNDSLQPPLSLARTITDSRLDSILLLEQSIDGKEDDCQGRKAVRKKRKRKRERRKKKKGWAPI